MIIRNYTASDLERCRSLWAEMVQRHRDVYEDPSIGDDDLGSEFDGHLSRAGPELVWVAVEEDEIVGLVSLILDDAQEEIEPIVVSSRHRGRG